MITEQASPDGAGAADGELMVANVSFFDELLFFG